MIRSRADLRNYKMQDLRHSGLSRWRPWMLLQHPTVHFVRVLRIVEYNKNAGSELRRLVIAPLWQVYFRLLSIYLGFTIPPNTCGPGLALNHWGTIVISPEARIGANARINVCVNIGIKDGKAPRIGDNSYIGPGAILFGDIALGNNVQIGANAVVNKSFPDDVVLVGVPAKAILSKSTPSDDAK
jgi:serine O-acetyltransferase